MHSMFLGAIEETSSAVTVTFKPTGGTKSKRHTSANLTQVAKAVGSFSPNAGGILPLDST